MKVGKYKVGAPLVSKEYKSKTPDVLEKIGDALVIAGTTVTGISAFTMPPPVTAIAAIITGLGKILTKCFGE